MPGNVLIKFIANPAGVCGISSSPCYSARNNTGPQAFLPPRRVCHSLDCILFWFIYTLSFLMGLAKTDLVVYLTSQCSYRGDGLSCKFLRLNQKRKYYKFKLFPLALILLSVYLHFHLYLFPSSVVHISSTLHSMLPFTSVFLSLLLLFSLCATVCICTVLLLYQLQRDLFGFCFCLSSHHRGKSIQYLLTFHQKIMMLAWRKTGYLRVK